MMDILSSSYLPGDQRFVDQIVRELKSQGIFDQFRKECISDVDTKPAYQNLRQRVENSVSGFLTKQKWNPEMNKNQVREMLRKNIYELGFLETGVERIVDQVVNPKITTVFLPKVEDIVYKFLGIEKPVKVENEDVQEEEESKTPEKTEVRNLSSKYLEGASPEIPEDKNKDEIDGLKEETENHPKSEVKDNETRIIHEENSVDSQSSMLSEIINQDSNQSQKQESVMSLNSSESRISSSENNSKMETDDVFLSQKSSDSNSKLDEESYTSSATIEIEKVQYETGEESKEQTSDKKRERHHSSSDKSKHKNEKDKNKKEQKSEDMKYRIPKLSSKNKTDKDVKSSSKDSKDRDRNTGKRSDKDRKSSKRSSERDHSRSESRNHKERKDRDKQERRDSSRSDKKDERKSSTSKDKSSSSSSSSSKSKEKDAKKRDSTQESSRKDGNKYKKDEKKSSKRDDKKRSKDDHYSSRDKNTGRRSSDRDSDGPPNSKNPPTSMQKETEKNMSKNTESNSSSNLESSAGDSGNSDKIENSESNEKINLDMIKLPKFASNFEEAKKIMKIRKQLKKLEHSNKRDDIELKKILKDISELSSKDTKINENIVDEENSSPKVPLNINDFISSPNISMAQWNALEAKFMEQMGNIDYDSYENPNNTSNVSNPENLSESIENQYATNDEDDSRKSPIIENHSFTENKSKLKRSNGENDGNYMIEIEKENIEINEMIELYIKNNIAMSNEKSVEKSSISTFLSDNDMCVGLELYEENEKFAKILACLVEALQNNINKSVETIQRITLKRRYDISNNNFENIVLKKPKLNNSDFAISDRKSCDNEHQQNLAAIDQCSSLPPVVSSDESEILTEKIIETKKTKRQSAPRNTNQRYSSEDLYKPRICLRRSRKDSPNS